MIRLLRAFALLRWRLFVNGLRGRRRDKLEQVSRISRVLVLAIVTLTFLPTAIMLALLASVGGWGLAQRNPNASFILVGARAAIGVLSLLVLVTPILRFGGSSSSMARLALLPIPRGLLWALEAGAQLADPWILAIVPALVAMPLGFASGGSAAGAVIVAVASLLVLAYLVALGSVASLGGALLFRNRRIGELAAIGVLVLISVVGYIPMLTRSRLPRREQVPVIDSTRYPWLKAAPWEQYALATGAAASGEPSKAVLPLAGLAATTGVLAFVSRWSFGRLLDSPGSRGTRARRSEARPVAVPGLTPAASAVAVSTFRLLLRSVRGRVMLFSSPLPVVMIGLVWKSFTTSAATQAPAGVVMVLLGGLMALVSMQTFLSDQFAVDRAGLTLTFLTPASDVDLVVGKAAAGLGALAIPTGIATLAGIVLRPSGAPPLWLAALIGVVAVYLIQAPIAALFAAMLPAPFDLMKLKGGNAHPLGTIASTLVTMLAMTLAVSLGIFVLWWTGSAWVTLLAAIGLLAVAAGFATLVFRAAARAVSLRRENLALIAQGR
jgi:hypothetical protein